MKRVKFILFSLACLCGIGAAFASNHHNLTRKFDDTYYAVSDGAGNFAWTATSPNGTLWICVMKNICTYCTIVVVPGYHPTNNECPDESKIVSKNPPYHSIYVQL